MARGQRDVTAEPSITVGGTSKDDQAAGARRWVRANMMGRYWQLPS
jgi:hypothetical protein